LDSSCNECRIQPLREHANPVIPDYRDGDILVVSDFPVIEDTETGLCMSGLHRRTTFVNRILHDAKVDTDAVSFASVLRCITKSKAIISMLDYERCGKIMLEEAGHLGFLGVLCFGSVAGSIVRGSKVTSIEAIRGKILESVIPGAFCVVTYSLGVLVDTAGCGGCGGNVHPTLAKKDVAFFYKEIKNRRGSK